VRRFAKLVEDHPLEYGKFEGVIPEGQYGAGAVIIWDKGTYEPAGGSLEQGAFEFVLKGRKLKGKFTLVLMKGRGPNNWLLIKKRDGLEIPGYQTKPELTPDKLKKLKRHRVD
jgi:bifunctional non-homologous end joining protein LigD